MPAFADVQVLAGWDGDTPQLVEPATKATVHQLVTHTTGLGYWFWSEDLVKYEQVTGIPNVVPGSMEAFKAPMVDQPGSRFVYGINTDWLGRVVEAVAGTTLDEVVRDGVTGPLGMDDTMFRLDAAHEARRVTVHVRDESGAWISAGETRWARTSSTARADTGFSPHPRTTSASSGRCCEAASSTANGS